MYNTAHASALPFKDNCLRSQIPTWASTLACTSDQFRSSWRPGPNHTLRMRTGLSLQRKDLSRRTLPLQAPSRKPSLSSKLILASAICFYLATAFFAAFMSRRRDTKTVILAYVDTFAERGPVKRILRRTGLASSFLNLQSRGYKSRTLGRDRGQPCWDWPLDWESLRAPPVHLHYSLRVVVYHGNPFAELRFESSGFQNSRQNRWSTLSKALDWSKLISAASVLSSIPSKNLHTKNKLS